MTYTVLSGTLNSSIPYHWPLRSLRMSVMRVVKRPGDLDFWRFHLATSAEYQPWDLPANVGVSANFRCRGMGIRLIWPHFLDAHVGDAGHRPASLYQVWSSSVSPFGRYDAFYLSINWPTEFDLWLLNGSPMSWASFLPIFRFLCPSILDLGSGTGQTDRQTMAINT